jgi:hypothetical protein
MMPRSSSGEPLGTSAVAELPAAGSGARLAPLSGREALLTLGIRATLRQVLQAGIEARLTIEAETLQLGAGSSHSEAPSRSPRKFERSTCAAEQHASRATLARHPSVSMHERAASVLKRVSAAECGGRSSAPLAAAVRSRLQA